MDSKTVQNFLDKDSTADVNRKIISLLSEIQNHADLGCVHCLQVLKMGLGNQPNPADDTKQNGDRCQ